MAGKVLDSFHVAGDEFTAALACDSPPAPVEARYAAPHAFDDKYRGSRAFTLVARSDVYLVFIAPGIAFSEMLGAEVDQDVSINFVAAAWAGVHFPMKEPERSIAARTGQLCVALNRRRVINPADHASIVSSP